MQERQEFEPGSWINIVQPSDDELLFLSDSLAVPEDILRAALDHDESARIEVEEDQVLLIIDIPVRNESQGEFFYETLPLGIIFKGDFIITVCLQDHPVLQDFRLGRVRGFFTYKRTRFTLQILFRVASLYLSYLKQIDRQSIEVERQLHRSTRNKELFLLLSLMKSLVYFSTSLKANALVFNKLIKGDVVKMYPEDQDVLEDVIIENRQAIEMAEVYSNILSSTMDAFASVISNNLNMVMKFLASVTIILSIPAIVASLYGMNVLLPLQDRPFAFLFVLLIALGLSSLAAFVLARRGMF
ncbi:MAG TPA: magnesium transporter CorA family protein [Firmicutes bacterium]|nr:magnesium transporter CorA family protein [Bacillota bacterium]